MLHIGYVNVTHRKDPKEETWCHSLGGPRGSSDNPHCRKAWQRSRAVTDHACG
jgi:hypothetical protein